MKFLLSCLSALFFIGCVSSKNSTDTNLSGNWELSVFPTTDKTFEEVFGQRRPELQFDQSKNTVSGTTGCNRINGSYSASNSAFSFGNNIAMTKMACPGYEESVFLEALNQINRYEITDGQLRLMHDSTLVMSFVRK
jgi:heat shock protein HslJ